MKINSIAISHGLDGDTLICFDKKWNLIWSKSNSQGKTTLIRFILFALGFQIPSTKKIDMNDYCVSISICLSKENYITAIRESAKAKIVYADKTEIAFNLANSSEKLSFQSILLGIKNNPLLVENILGAIYIDQEKGWTLLNRGKTIGANSFDIQDFIASLTGRNVANIDARIETVEKEIKKYTSIFDIVSMAEEEKDEVKIDENLKVLFSRKNNIEVAINEKRNTLEELKVIESNNNTIIDLIESYKLVVCHEDKKFLLQKEDIEDFIINENILLSKISLLEIEIHELEKSLLSVKEELRKYEGLFNVEEASASIVKSVQTISIDQTQLNDLLAQLKDERSRLKKERIELIRYSNNKISFLSNLVTEISTYLNVFEQFLKTEGDFLFTHNLKAYSGAILHKIVFSFRLSYFLFLKEQTGMDFPMIIDSPGAAEMTNDSICEILKILKEKCGSSQIIVSSIYKDFDSIEFEKVLTLEDGVFGKKNY